MKTKKLPRRPAGNLPRTLILVPSIPSPGASPSERPVDKALSLLARERTVLCLPEDRPLSARLDEAALAAKGVEVYAFAPATRGEIFSRFKTLLADNPDLDSIGMAGLEVMRRHLIAARLFAPYKSFFAVLGSRDVLELTRDPELVADDSAGFPDRNRRLLSCCDAVFCETAEDAKALRGMFRVNARELAAISGVLGSLKPRREEAPVRTGFINFERPFPSPRGAFKPVVRKKAAGLAGINELIRGSGSGIEVWAAASGPFSACGAFWPRLKEVLRAFPDAGMVLPGRAAPGKADGPRASRVFLDAFSLSRQGRYSEPLLIDDLPLGLLRPEAFLRAGGFDPRFSSGVCAWTDLALKMRQAGFDVISADDAVLSCESGWNGERPDQRELDLLTRKWCAQSLHIMELLLFELGGRQP